MKDVFDLLAKNEQNSLQLDTKRLLINQNWILVNKINETKTVYVFHEDNKLTRTKNGLVSEAQWHYVNPNYIRITSNGSIDVIKMTFRDEDILTLDIDRHSNELAVFINQSKSDIKFSTHEDITDYLHDKYINKAKSLIYNHQYYYVEQSTEFGPYTAEYLIEKAKKNNINAQCLIRDVNDSDYSKRLRIQDLIDVI